jgi:N utilization substance protein B
LHLTVKTKTSRRRSRELALQGMYQWQLAGTDVATLVRQLAEARDFDKVDPEYFRMLLEGAIADAPGLEQAIAPHLDRAFKRLSPVERGILLLAGYELTHRPDVPYRAVINEAVELAKSFGGDRRLQVRERRARQARIAAARHRNPVIRACTAGIAAS